MIRFWAGCVKLLAVGYLFSYFWTASTAIYFLLRHDVDATEMDEVFLDADATEQDCRACRQLRPTSPRADRRRRINGSNRGWTETNADAYTAPGPRAPSSI